VYFCPEVERLNNLGIQCPDIYKARIPDKRGYCPDHPTSARVNNTGYEEFHKDVEKLLDKEGQLPDLRGKLRKAKKHPGCVVQ
jgi:hypothetical protein